LTSEAQKIVANLGFVPIFKWNYEN
jgi:hypothetical protein